MKIAALSLLLLLPGCAALAQVPELEPWNPELEPAEVPTVIFTYSLAGGDPEHFGVAVNSAGRAAYQSRGRIMPGGEPREPYFLKFVFSEANRARVFELVRDANYLEGDFDFTRHPLANMGAKTLRYQDRNRRASTTYNWSQHRAIQQLTELFHSVSHTLEFGRRLAYLHRYDRLGIDAELKAMEAAAKNKRLAEVQVVAPLLRGIAADPAIMKVARQRAQRLLEKWGEPLEAAALPRE